MCTQHSKLMQDNIKIAFFGDSITQEGRYITAMSDYFNRHMSEKGLELINLGLSGETISGLSENPAEPRPCVFDRANKLMKENKPDWIIVCYGMNDGGFSPFSEDRLDAYKKGIYSMIELAKAHNAGVILVTPTPFDAYSSRVVVNRIPVSADNDFFDGQHPYEGYNDVLKKYRDWILSIDDEYVHMVVDIYTPLSDFIKDERKKDASYTYGDGVHPYMAGHCVIARTLLQEIFQIDGVDF